MSVSIASIAFVITQRQHARGHPLEPHARMEEQMRTRTQLLQVWLDDKEYEQLTQRSNKSGLTKSGYIRQLIAGIQPRDLPPPDFRPMMRQLYYCGNSLNQIARKAYALNVIDAQHYEEAVKLFRKTVMEISKAAVCLE